ncbi:GIY-YIG nuclease family protein [Methylocystis sp. H62]|uniref:GIY-YIG nuclease family protein n=1 Tax=Methylocystis sp. H62 TaxID=2785789 RepID=UPI0018C2237F|nr:GIY-YIG nuclease family protein [Methylocystis sp. H62]MBG0794806.1 GIY-YIG nuclease family protein [Methylocystis sp. H62]
MIFVASAVFAPATSGAYALALRLGAPLEVRIGKNSATLAAGDYLYCGSAHGSGGLRARLARHMRPHKRAHWHIDQLAAVANMLGAFVEEQGDECALNAALGALSIPLPIPVAGFGSSDCRRCAAHLRFWPEGAALPSDWENARKAAHLSLEGGGRAA